MSKRRPDKMYFGGAVGVDDMALKLTAAILWDLSKTDKHYVEKVKLIGVTPDLILNNPPVAAETMKNLCDEIIELKNKIQINDGWNSYRIRNQYLVDHCDLLLAFPQEGLSTGGTYDTIGRAIKAKVELIITEI